MKKTIAAVAAVFMLVAVAQVAGAAGGREGTSNTTIETEFAFNDVEPIPEEGPPDQNWDDMGVKSVTIGGNFTIGGDFLCEARLTQESALSPALEPAPWGQVEKKEVFIRTVRVIRQDVIGQKFCDALLRVVNTSMRVDVRVRMLRDEPPAKLGEIKSIKIK